MAELRDDRLEVASFRTICEESPIGIFLCDENGLEVYANPVSLWQMGLTAEEARGEGWRRAIHPEDRPTVFRRFAEAIRAGEIYAGENRYLWADGTVVWVKVHVSTIREEGRILGFVGTAEDITARKRLEEDLHRAEVMNTIGRMAGGIAHDFNNLLVAVIGHAELASGALDDRARVRTSLTAIRDAGERAAELTRQLLTIAKHEVIKPEVIDIGTELKSLEKLLRAVIREDIELVFRVEPSVGPVLIDPTQLQRLVFNLVLNARSAIDGPGRITVRARAAAAGPDDAVELTVSDTGRGMDERTRARIFEPFFRDARSSGAGLGLSTCYAIVQRAGGSIDVGSAPGEGTTFRVVIPATGRSVSREPPSDRVRPAISGRSILLVDDDSAVRTVLALGLRAQGFAVHEAESLKQALRTASGHEGRIDLVISDVVLGDGSGLELRERLAGTRFLFVSGYADDVVLQQAVESGDVEFLAKPFSIATLVDKIERVLA